MPAILLDPAAAAPAPITTIGAPATSGGAFSLTTLYNELMLRLGDRTDVTMTRAATWINSAASDIAESLDLPSLKGGVAFNTIAGQPLYLLPANLKTTKFVSIVGTGSVVGTDERKLIELDERKYRMLPSADGNPSHYLALDTLLVLWPTPTVVEQVVVDGVFDPQDLSATDPTKRHILGSSWNEGLLRLATSYGFNALIEPELAANAENQFVSWVRRKNDPSQQNTNTIARFSVPRSERDLHRSRLPQLYDDGQEEGNGRW